MKGRLDGCRAWLRKYRRMNMFLVCIVLVLAIAAAGFNLTKDKAPKTVPKDVKVENEGGEDLASNPLQSGKYPEVERAVQDYYARLADNTDFVERYEHVNVYTKLGKYKGDYVAFTRYDMKIKDIYTEVPGLGTLYLEKDKKSGELKVDTKAEAEGVSDYVKAIAAHEDVKQLMANIQADYANAVASDALLAEALEDLKNAYENSVPGTIGQ